MGQAMTRSARREDVNIGRDSFPSKTAPNRRPASAPGERARVPGDAPAYSEKCDPRPRRTPLTEDQRALAARYLRLASAMAAVMARRLGCGALDRDELESAAYLALVEAAGRFDAGRNVDFATYARHRVRGALLTHKRERAVRLTGRDAEGVVRAGAGVSALAPRSIGARSLDRLPGSVVGRSDAPEVGAELERSDLVEQYLGRLPAVQASACRLLYVDGKSQDEAAAILGFSKSYLSRLHKNAIEQLARADDVPAAPGFECMPHAA